jgi:hypothetical protein
LLKSGTRRLHIVRRHAGEAAGPCPCIVNYNSLSPERMKLSLNVIGSLLIIYSGQVDFFCDKNKAARAAAF